MAQERVAPAEYFAGFDPKALADKIKAEAKAKQEAQSSSDNAPSESEGE